MKYWQNEETGMCCAVEKQPSPRHYEISKEAYEAHERGLTTGAVDLGDSSALEVGSTPEVLSAGQGESRSAPNH